MKHNDEKIVVVVGKQNIVLALSTKCKLTEEKSNEVFEELLNIVRDNLVAGNAVILKNVGTLTPKVKKAGTRTAFGKEVRMKERITVAFTRSKELNVLYEKSKGRKLSVAEELKDFRAKIKN